MPTFRTALIIVVTAASVAACGSASKKAKAGSIGGDIYLTMESGDVKKNAGAPVFLVRPSDSLIAALSNICGAYKHDADAWLKRAKSLPYSRGMPVFDSISTRGEAAATAFVSRLASSAAAETKATMEAHYAFHDVAPGQYLLFSERQGYKPTEWGKMTNISAWLVPVTVAPGDSLTRDLDNSLVTEDLWGTKPRPNSSCEALKRALSSVPGLNGVSDSAIKATRIALDSEWVK
jgi:hypothetical protein